MFTIIWIDSKWCRMLVCENYTYLRYHRTQSVINVAVLVQVVWRTHRHGSGWFRATSICEDKSVHKTVSTPWSIGTSWSSWDQYISEYSLGFFHTYNFYVSHGQLNIVLFDFSSVMVDETGMVNEIVLCSLTSPGFSFGPKLIIEGNYAEDAEFCGEWNIAFTQGGVEFYTVRTKINSTRFRFQHLVAARCSFLLIIIWVRIWNRIRNVLLLVVLYLQGLNHLFFQQNNAYLRIARVIIRFLQENNVIMLKQPSGSTTKVVKCIRNHSRLTHYELTL